MAKKTTKTIKKTKEKPKKEPLKIDKQAAKFDRLPPQNIEAEQSVLGSLMLDRDAVIKVSDILGPADFYRGAHQFIFETMLELFERNEPIDLLSASIIIQLPENNFRCFQLDLSIFVYRI